LSYWWMNDNSYINEVEFENLKWTQAK
jgi:hypothetical protein